MRCAWQAWRVRQPREYDGDIVGVEHVDASSRVIAARREKYRFLAVGKQAGVNVRLLAVTGIVTAIDQDGDECVLLGRRSGETRIYGGLWEFGPSGGVKCPATGVTRLDERALVGALKDEGLEELGISLEMHTARPIAVVGDDEAASEDVIVRVELASPVDSRAAICSIGPEAGWEYVSTAWVPVMRLGGWITRHAGAMIPPSVALARWMGWA